MAAALQLQQRMESHCRAGCSGRSGFHSGLTSRAPRHVALAGSGARLQHASRIAAFPIGAPDPAFTAMDRVMQDTQRSLWQQVDRDWTSSPFQDIERMQQRMDAQFRAMDREFERFDQEMQQFDRDMDAALSRNLRDLQQQQPDVRIDRQEQRSPGMYRYYESIQIHSGPRMAAIVPLQAATPSPFISPALLAAAVLTGMYAALSAAFARNYNLTTYQQQKRWQLLLLWPVLVLVSKQFRQQWLSAMRGEKVRVSSSQDEQEVKQ